MLMDSDDFGGKVKTLLDEICSLKEQITGEILDYQDSFKDTVNQVSSMLADVEDLQRQSKALQAEKNVLPRLVQTKKEHKALVARLERLELVEGTLQTLVTFHTTLVALEEAAFGEDLWRAVDLTRDLLRLLPQTKVPPEDLPVFDALRLSFFEVKEKLRARLVQEWSSAVVWEENAEEDSCRLRLLRSPADLQRLLSALAVVLEARHCVRSATDRLVHRLLLPFARGERELQCAPELPDGIAFVSRLPAIQRVLPPAELFPRLQEVLRAASENFLGLQMGESGERVVDFVRSAGSEPLVTALIENCIARSLPASQEELRTFAEDLQPRCAALERQLGAWGVVETDAKRLSAYVLEIDALFLEKKKESLLVRGRDLMRQPLFDIAQAGEDSSSSGDKDPDPFSFPACFVSKAVLAIVALFDATIDEGVASSNDEFKSQLYLALNNLFECYPRIVATVHRDALQDVPQAAAIFACNCKFLAHHCLLDLRLARLLPNASLVHLVHHLRAAADEQLQRQLQRQRDQLDDAMLGFGGLQEAAENAGRVMGVARHCCRQLGVLSRVWRVLPKKVYGRVLGSMLNHVVSRVVSDVIALSDIASNDSDVLLELLELLLSEGLLLFSAPASDGLPAISFAADAAALGLQLPSFVPAWPRLQELAFVLNASLVAISDRWAAGKGPLAEALAVAELRALVRALFQNTEKRAAVLAKIR